MGNCFWRRQPVPDAVSQPYEQGVPNPVPDAVSQPLLFTGSYMSQPYENEPVPHTYGETITEKTNDSIHGVEVIAEKEFVVPTKGGSFEWMGYGLRLSVSEDSLPAGMEECKVNIKASLTEPFQLPEDSDLLSPVFWISAPCNSMNPVTLYIQHCASRDDASSSDLKFVSAKCTQKDHLYIFKQLDGGVFSRNSSYGSIQLSHFCGIGIAGRRRTERSYCGQILTTKKKVSDWRVFFIVTLNHDALTTLVRRKHEPLAGSGSTLIKFDGNQVSLNIPDDGIVTKEGWKITPLSNPTFLKEDVDRFKPGSESSFPHECQLIVRWEKKRQSPVHLMHKIELIGVRKPYDYLRLDLDPEWEANTMSTPATYQFKPDDLGALNRLLHPVAGYWVAIADQLRMESHVPEIESTPVNTNPPKCLRDILVRWIDRGHSTLEVLCQGLRADPAIIGGDKAAHNLEKEFQNQWDF